MNIIVFDSGITQPEDRGIVLRDIIEDATTEKEKSYCIDANYHKGSSVENYIDKSRRQMVKQLPHGNNNGFEKECDKMPSITTSSCQHNNLVKVARMVGRKIDENGTRKDYSDIQPKQRLELRPDDKSGCLTGVQKDNCLVIGKADLNGHDICKRVYSVDHKSPTVPTGQSGNTIPKINDTEISWRKLTPIECEHLQTVNTIYEIEVELCLDQIKNYVNAVEKSHKLQKLVLSVEKNELIEFANLAVKNIQLSNPRIKHTALQSVDTLIQKIIDICMKHNQKEKNIIVDFAEKKTTFNYQSLEVDFVIQNVFTNIIQEKIINSGKAELRLKDRNLCYQSSGKKRLKMYGKEIMQFVEIADMIFQRTEIEKCTFTTLYHLNMINIDQILIILYWYAKVVTDIFTQIEIPEKNILLNCSFENSYTNHVSNSQRYKKLGNGWTVDVIAHIFKHILKSLIDNHPPVPH